MGPWAYLGLAIAAEVVATSALKASEGFSRFWPSALVVLGYGLSFYLLSLTLKSIPLGVVYAVWSGLGIVLIALVAYLMYGQRLDLPALLGIALILSGVVIIHRFSSVS
ncbi:MULTISPECIES: DMT family transporter [Spongiibacter]|jgi:small multidrug resistance pump|uniref:DMT family transporter n=2 Tax=Spongiibacteraceae TaxID=1706375 RepID=UPI0003B77230|nr:MULTISPECIES: multidrug efflux SMR transporter [Spongiibacter]MAY38543.1 QacE family quaternary ammonium compound efflux SMR transporter [Spongiibacter sp.]MBI59229.1 QacE family quaternary ammonium compound efflux SMR transporter [Spongiibacter sp.]|tara:strand:- start:4717 stop:5043 length:327 start_codon:yes stop_codon:yes gene_type:complete